MRQKRAPFQVGHATLSGGTRRRDAVGVAARALWGCALGDDCSLLARVPGRAVGAVMYCSAINRTVHCSVCFFLFYKTSKSKN